MTTPYSNRPKITQIDISNGYVTRYFVRNVSTRMVTEIDKKQYEAFKNNVLYEKLELQWNISGFANDIVSTDNKIIYGTKHKNSVIIEFYNRKLPGLSRLLSNPLEYFQGVTNTPVVPPIETKYNEDEIGRAVEPFVEPTREIREYSADFELKFTYLSSGSSLTQRPDAVSLDYKTTYTLGPIAISSGSDGLFERVWKVWGEEDALTGTHSVWYAIESASSWSSDSASLFTYTGTSSIELDAAFDQSGRLYVVTQRYTGSASEVWLYFYNPLETGFVFNNLGSGRTPRMSLDNWRDTTDSDVLVFYVDDTQNKIKYRAQKDRFTASYDTPINTTENTYIEKVGFGADNRYRVTYVERNTSTGKYEIKQLATLLYPFPMTTEAYMLTGSFLSMSLIDTLITTSIDTEAYTLTGSFLSMSIIDTVITPSIDTEAYILTGSFLSMSLTTPVITVSIDTEAYILTGSFLSMSAIDILVTRSLDEAYMLTGSFLSASIITV
jgi:uncharacterized membrane protein